MKDENKKFLAFNEALKIMNSHGFVMSRSKLYKLTAQGIIPCLYFGKRLVFDTVELLNWCNSQLKTKHDFRNESEWHIVNDARNKLLTSKSMKNDR